MFHYQFSLSWQLPQPPRVVAACPASPQIVVSIGHRRNQSQNAVTRRNLP
jgi:hypothetical protein